MRVARLVTSVVRALPSTAANVARPNVATNALRSMSLLRRPTLSAPRVTGNVRCFASFSEVIPSLGDSISEGTINEWQKKPGEWVNRDEVLAVVETDKVSVELRATKAGVLEKQLVEAKSVVKVGTPFAQIDVDAKPPAGAAAPKAAAAPVSAPAPAAPTAAPVVAAPVAPVAAPVAAPAKPAPSAAPAKPQPAPVIQRGERTSKQVPLTRMRQTIAKRLMSACTNTAMLTTFNEIDMTNLMAMRAKYKEDFEKKHAVKLGFMSAFVKASANALQRWPDVNAYYKEAEGVIEYHDFVDIGVAVATPTGLVVPNLRNVENMTFRDIEAAINGYSLKARANKIAMEDMAGGTFTISNGGVFGSLFGTPILNPPQSAILGMHAINRKPWVVTEGDTEKIEIRPIMVVALTYDHRIIDGSTAVQFLKDIKNGIEDPSRMLLEM